MATKVLPSIISEISADKVVDSILMSGVSNSMIDIVMNEIPEEFQNNAQIQSMIQQIQHTEREYIPLYRDWQNSGLFSEFHKTLFRLMGVLYVVGVIACLSLILGTLALLGLIVVLGIYLYARWRVLKDIKQRLDFIRQQLVSQTKEFFNLQATFVKAKRDE